MSAKFVRRKHLEEQLHVVPESLEDNQTVARVVKLHGSNIVEVETPKRSAGHANANDGDGDGRDDESEGLACCLCLLPAKFSKRFWIKRGNFVVIEFTVGEDHGKRSTEGKIKGSITHILYPDQVKELKKAGDLWPAVFNESEEEVVERRGPRQATGADGGGEGIGGGSEGEGDSSDSDSDGLPPLPPNPNRPKGYYSRDDDDDDSESESSS